MSEGCVAVRKPPSVKSMSKLEGAAGRRQQLISGFSESC